MENSAPVYQIQSPEAFSFKPDDWPRWRRRFERFRQASGLQKQEETILVNSLLYLMGEQAEEIYRSFKFTKKDEN